MLILTPEELNEAVKRLGTYPYDEAFKRLINNAEHWSSSPTLALSKVRRIDALYIYHNLFLELALAYLITKKAKYCGYAISVIKIFEDKGWDAPQLPKEIHHAYLLTGLGVFFDLTKDDLSSSSSKLIENILIDIAQRLATDAKSKAWGQCTPARNAWNHSIAPSAALGFAGLLLSNHPDSTHWLHFGSQKTKLFFRDGITSQGLTREGLQYCGFVFRPIGLFLRALRISGKFDYLTRKDNPNFDKLRAIPDWYYASLFPNGKYFQNYNDSHMSPHHVLDGFLLTFSPLRPNLVSHIWERTLGKSGLGTFGQDKNQRLSNLFETILWHPGNIKHPSFIHNIPKTLLCRDYGYFVESSSHQPDRTIFAFTSGRFIGDIHDQSDNNSFTLISGKVPLVIDSGYANSPEEKSASSSYGHSSVLIDGKGQRPSGAGQGVNGRIILVEKHEGHTIIIGDSTDSYRSGDYNIVRLAIRSCVFFKQPFPYLIIFDDISKDDNSSHEYEFIFHTPHLTSIDKLPNGFNGIAKFDSCRFGLHVALLNPGNIKMGSEVFPGPPISPIKDHLLWHFSTQAVRPNFLGMFLPYHPAQLKPYTYQITHSHDTVELAIEWSSENIRTSIIFPKRNPRLHNTTPKCKVEVCSSKLAS